MIYIQAERKRLANKLYKVIIIERASNLFLVDKSAKLKKWKSREVNGLIFVWYHVDDNEPWSIPVVPEIENNEWVFHGKNEFLVNSHIQDIPENGAGEKIF